MATLSEYGEKRAVAELLRMFDRGFSPGLGDDCGLIPYGDHYLLVTTDVVNEKTGTVVIGDKVRIAPVALAHGSLTIEIKTEYQVSQPSAFGPEGSRTAVVPRNSWKHATQHSPIRTGGGTSSGIFRSPVW
jgi:hypothetical protein